MTQFDVLIIGSGAAGQTVAAQCGKAGKSVAVIDRLPFGGTCGLRGCIPKKLLLSAAEAVRGARNLKGKGVTGECAIDWPELMARKRAHIAPTPENHLKWMHDMGITTIDGAARFVSPDSLEVAGEVLGASAIVLATGARPMDLTIEGAELLLTSTDFLDLSAMPARVAFVGGGYVSFELSWLAHAAGAQATIVHRSAQVLQGFDPDLAQMLAERYQAQGITILTDAPVERIERRGEGAALITPAGVVEADIAVHGAGRVPDLDGLDLEAGGVQYSRRGVSVDAHLQSVSNPIVWACGDAAALGTPLTPVAGAQGEVVAAGILGEDATYDDGATPSVVFSDPPLARVGADVEVAATDESLHVRAYDMSDWFAQTRVGNTVAAARLVVDRETGTLKGAHLLGAGVDEVINVFTLAIKFGITLEELRTVTWTYPTLSYEINYLTGRY
jgi:glutathione reductase (NADPH)